MLCSRDQLLKELKIQTKIWWSKHRQSSEWTTAWEKELEKLLNGWIEDGSVIIDESKLEIRKESKKQKLLQELAEMSDNG